MRRLAMTVTRGKIVAINNFAQSPAWVFFGMLMAVSFVYAAEPGQKSPQRSEPPVKNPAGTAGYEKLLRDADALVKSGKPGDAYKLLEPFEFEHSGETRFDYLFGIAALDSGRPDRATLAFERVLAVDPDFAAARLDMARAYFQLGDLPRARTEFTLTLNQNPSAAARLTIQRYLDEIAAQEKGKHTRITGYIEGTAGRDNNVNNSTSQAQIFVDFLGTNITLDPTNVKVSDNYYGVAAGGEVAHSLNAKWGLYAGGDIRQRGNQTQKQFDALSLDARTGVMFGAGGNSLRAGVIGGRYNLGDMHNRDISGFNAEWRHASSPGDQLNVFGQYAQYRFADAAMKVNDFNQQVLAPAGSMFWGTAGRRCPAACITARKKMFRLSSRLQLQMAGAQMAKKNSAGCVPAAMQPLLIILDYLSAPARKPAITARSIHCSCVNAAIVYMT